MDELAWSATALLTHPEVIREVHEDYITSGADIITTNTFGTLGLSLRSTTLADRVSEVNRTAVRLAQEARARSDAARPIWIGGSNVGHDRHGLLAIRWSESANIFNVLCVVSFARPLALGTLIP